jgi:hypothetical protein
MAFCLGYGGPAGGGDGGEEDGGLEVNIPGIPGQDYPIYSEVSEQNYPPSYLLCTGAFLYVRYIFLLISNKFCDFGLLHWPMFMGV